MTSQQTLTHLPTGAKTPDFSLQAADGRAYSLDSFAGEPFLVVVFLANHCPYVGAWEGRLLAIARDFADRGVAFVGISSNLAEDFPQDGFEEMRKRAQEKDYPFPYLHDSDQSVARAYGATRTPEVFVFDGERELRYHGAIDSDYEESSSMESYLRDALTRLTTGRPVFMPETHPIGCRIKLH